MTYPNLEAELKRCGYTRNDIADVLGIHVSGVSAMMTGKREFSIYRARKLRDALFPDMRIDYLFDQNPSEAGTEKSERHARGLEEVEENSYAKAEKDRGRAPG